MSSTPNVLQQLFGFSAFREGQKEAVDSLLSGHSTLAIFPTGSGKSFIIYALVRYYVQKLPDQKILIEKILIKVQILLNILRL